MPLKQLLTPLPFTQVQLHDAFWAPRMLANRSATLPAEYAQLESTGRLAALELAWQPGAGNPPHIFWDSDIAKWIEAAAYALAAQFDAQLDAQLDAVIARLARAQQPDGYLNTHFIVTERAGLQRRWTNLRDSHELYCAGHLIEAAVAHFEATGKRTLLDVMCRYADCIDRSFGRGAQQQRGYPGHEEIELALVKLHRATGEARYLALARYFIDERGQQPHYFDGEARARGGFAAWPHLRVLARGCLHLVMVNAGFDRNGLKFLDQLHKALPWVAVCLAGRLVAHQNSTI